MKTKNPWSHSEAATEEVPRGPFEELAARVAALVNETDDLDVVMNALVAVLGMVILTNARSAKERERIVRTATRQLHKLFRDVDEDLAEESGEALHGGRKNTNDND